MNLSRCTQTGSLSGKLQYYAHLPTGVRAARWPPLIRQEKERQAANEDEDRDDFLEGREGRRRCYPARRSRNTNGEMRSTLISTRTRSESAHRRPVV